MNEKRCRRCLLREAYPSDYQKYIVSLLEGIPDRQRTADMLYEARLDICRACEQLNNGTCMGCGCLVELRAAYNYEKCPFDRWPVRNKELLK